MAFKNPTYRTMLSTHRFMVFVRIVVSIVLFFESLNAQNFYNSGTLKNNGTFRVRKAVTGLPDTVGGTFEYFGESQEVQSTTYNNLQLTAPTPSTKTTPSGAVTVLHTATVSRDVTYQLQPNALLTLSPEAGRLTEEGLVLGRIQKEVNLTASSDSTDFGGIGAALKYVGTPLGSTEVLRIAGTSPASNAVKRSFHVTPSFKGRITGTISFTYNVDEIPTGSLPQRLELWRSVDGGTTWRRQRTIHDVDQKRLTRVNWYVQGIWTAADSSNLLGPANYEGDPDVMLAQKDSLRGRVRTYLEPFTIQVTDIFGQPVPSTKVKVSILQVPNEATEYAVTDTLGVPLPDSTLYTDNDGVVKVRLKLGSKRGYYRLRVHVDTLSHTSKELIAFADAGISSIASVSETVGDTVKSVIPFTIEARDDGHLSVPDVNVKFELIAWPTGATKQAIVAMDTVTNTTGRAQAVIRLGEKVGPYTLKVTSPELDTSYTFTLVATHGAPALAWQRSVSSVEDTIGATYESFTYAVTDIDTNAVPNRPLRVRFVAKPEGSIGDSLLYSTVSTDVRGEFKFAVKLGTKVGEYIVGVDDPGIQGSEKRYTLKALPGAPVLARTFATAVSDTIGAVLPPLSFKVMDRGENPIPDIPVHFTFASLPSDAQGMEIKNAHPHTDSTGTAITLVTLGNKVGQYVVRVHSEALPWATYDFAFVAKPGAPSLMVVQQGMNQEKQILQPLDSLFVVQLADRAMNPIPNDTIYFSISAAPPQATGHALDRAFALTDSNGMASVRLTLGNKVGLYSVNAYSARVPGVLQIFDARALNGAPRYLAYREGREQVRPILTTLDTAFIVTVTDIGENPVPGTPVRFTVTRTPQRAYGYGFGPTVSADTTILSDSSGVASLHFTLGSKVGEYEVAAFTNVPDTVRFVVRATVGAPFALRRVAGVDQVGQIGDQLLPFVVRLQDIGENDIAGTPVSFTIIEKPQYTIGDSLTNAIGITDSLGMASTQLTLGLRGGTYKVRATSGSIDTIFTAVALIVFADVNNDNYQNIGDVTAIIDHILGRRLLTGAAFIKADIKPTYPDGSYGDNEVDIFDLVAVIDSIQSGRWNPVRNAIRHYQQTVQRSVLAKTDGGQSSLATMNNVGSSFQITHIATRFALHNEVPIKGIQAVLYLNRPVQLDTVDLVFNRAKMMNINVKSENNAVRILVYNMNNTPIEPDSGALFRFPVKLLSPSEIDSMHVLVSVDTNVAAMVPYIAQDITAYIPSEWMLYQNYPNPFNPMTTIEFDVPEVPGKMPRVAIQIFNMLGQKVRTLEPGVRDVGRYRVVWNGRDDGNRPVASGVYFYRLLAGEYTSTKKMILLK